MEPHNRELCRPESYAGRATIHGLVEEQVARTPDAIAMRTGAGETLTYRQLDDRAEALAGWLQRAGAGPERLIRKPRTSGCARRWWTPSRRSSRAPKGCARACRR
jgi:non-ribosomal peptide synthetase component E (peptide arylation enzyme)